MLSLPARLAASDGSRLDDPMIDRMLSRSARMVIGSREKAKELHSSLALQPARKVQREVRYRRPTCGLRASTMHLPCPVLPYLLIASHALDSRHRWVWTCHR